MKTYKAKLEGVAPLIMHNGHLANPTNDFAKRMKMISGKKKKTEEDQLNLMELEWLGSLYVGANKELIIPANMIEAVIVNGAKQDKRGNAFKAAVYVENDSKFVYKGPQEVSKLQEDPSFRLDVMVKIKSSRVLRRRPIFMVWSLEIEVVFDEKQINQSDLETAVRKGGMMYGLGDWHPKYGRFKVVSSEVL